MSRSYRSLLALAALSVALSGTRAASAFCRTTTCDPKEKPSVGCPVNKQGCETTGLPLFWASNCLTVSVQADAALTQNIDYAAAEESAKRAFAAWTGADCAGAPPSITVDVQGAVECRTSEYNSNRANANLILFREDEWPYPGGQDALGETFINFDPRSGEIWDADIEINAVKEKLSVDPGPDEVDLDSLLTHEAGHVLGLGHTQDRAATMFPGYNRGSTGLRTLGYDDVSGLCAIYPASRSITSTSCVPRHGFSGLCRANQPVPPKTTTDGGAPDAASCSVSTRRSSPFVLVLSVSMAAFLAHRRRRRRD